MSACDCTPLIDRHVTLLVSYLELFKVICVMNPKNIDRDGWFQGLIINDSGGWTLWFEIVKGSDGLWGFNVMNGDVGPLGL